MTKQQRNEIIAFKAKNDWSFQLIADAFGLTRHQVAGIIFRHKRPYDIRVCSPNSHSKNKLGTGYRGSGPYAKFTASKYEARA